MAGSIKMMGVRAVPFEFRVALFRLLAASIEPGASSMRFSASLLVLGTSLDSLAFTVETPLYTLLVLYQG